MLLGRKFRGHTCGGPPYLNMRVPEKHSGGYLARYRQSFSINKQQERILWLGIVDTKTISFVFLLILPCWRVFFLGSPALHNAGTDRLQMVGVRSLHVDRSWLLVSSYSRPRPIFLPPKALEVRHDWDQNPVQHTVFQLISESCNKMLEIIANKMYFIDLFILYCGSSATSKKEAGRRKKNKELPEPQKDSPVIQLFKQARYLPFQP